MYFYINADFSNYFRGNYSGWKITRVKLKKENGNQESHERCNRATW